ncbi:MAG TPA: glycosyltransferase family 1 protein [Planctomycetota bacterium]|nr:glycosyltransferase family 1 protein [Planctomycetota bacterium]
MRAAINALLLSGRFSGVEKAIYALLRHIGEGVEDEFVALVGSDFDERVLNGARIGIERLPVSNRSRLFRIVYEEHFLRRRLTGFDLFHAPGYVAPKHLPCPLVLTIYDLIALTHPELARRSNAWHYRWRLPRSARAAARIIVPLECVARQVVERLGIARERVRVVPLGVDARLKPPSLDDRARARARHHLARPYILFVGNVEPKKNLATLLRAFAALKRDRLPHELLLAGKRGWKCREVLRLPAELGIEDDVRFLGYVEEDDLAGLYGGAELFAFPSLVEGFGLPPLEAMACGTPVVTSDAEALVESTGDAAEHVPALDPEALAEAMRRVLGDAALRERLRGAGFERSAQFTWQRTAEMTRAVHREAAGCG